MKKYIIRNVDGSEQNEMQAVYESCEEAGASMMNYIRYHNKNCDADNYLSPFDFILEEVEYPKVNETITDFERARKALGLDIDFQSLEYMIKVADFVEAINSKHIDALIALNKLFTLAEAWNKEDGFVPDFSDWNQGKWFPWFEYNKNVAGFVYVTTGNTPTTGHTLIGSRLCFKTSERAAQFGRQFVDLYNRVFL